MSLTPLSSPPDGQLLVFSRQLHLPEILVLLAIPGLLVAVLVKNVGGRFARENGHGGGDSDVLAEA